MTVTNAESKSLVRSRKAVSPAISSIILTGAVIAMLMVTIVFANNFLNSRMAENDFYAMKQFMQTTSLQIDDVAWTIGRTQTIRYASKFGHVSFESVALNYAVYIDPGSGTYVSLTNYSMGVLMFNMPVAQYTVTNNYHEAVFPSDRSFLQIGTSAPIAHVYVIEKIPMKDGNFIRVVVAPSIRMLNSTISNVGETRNYFKFYLPILSSGINPRYSQSVTLVGNSVTAITESNVNRVKIRVSAPKTSLGFDLSFFRFDRTEVEVDIPNGSIIQFYAGEVIVSLGLHS